MASPRILVVASLFTLGSGALVLGCEFAKPPDVYIAPTPTESGTPASTADAIATTTTTTTATAPVATGPSRVDLTSFGVPLSMEVPEKHDVRAIDDGKAVEIGGNFSSPHVTVRKADAKLKNIALVKLTLQGRYPGCNRQKIVREEKDAIIYQCIMNSMSPFSFIQLTEANGVTYVCENIGASEVENVEPDLAGCRSLKAP